MPELPGQAEAEARYAPPLPPQVRAQVAAAEALIQPPGSPPTEQPGAPQAPSEPAGQPPGVQPQASPPAAGEPPGQVDWEQRFRSSQGRLNTLQQQLEAQAQRSEQLERLIATMEAQGVPAGQQDGQVAQTYERLVTDDEERDYGADLLDVVGRRAREVIVPEIETVQQRLDRLEGRVNGVGTVIAQNETRTVWQMLNDGVGPNWNEINHHPAFHHWLDVPDPYSGETRRKLLTEAFDRHDGRRVLNFFQGFLNEANGTPSTPQPQPGPTPSNGVEYGKRPLEDFAAPGRARSEPQQLAPDKPVYSRASIEKFFGDRRKGVWRGREADADAIEADIFRAQHEGRIR